MRTNICRLAVVVFLLLAGIGNVSAPVIVGYVNYMFKAGSNLLNNPLQSGPSGSNMLSEVLSGSIPPDGTTVSLWNPSTLAFDTTSTFSNGSWSIDLLLPPGIGALLITPSSFHQTYVGAILNHDGSLWSGYAVIPAPVFSGPDGIYLLGDKRLINNTGTNIFINILGRLPFTGEQVSSLTSTSTYLGHGVWDSVPTLEVGQAAFFHIKSEPALSLNIIHTNNQVIVSWPPLVSDWTLQTNNNLATGTWGKYQGSIINRSVTNSMLTGDLFFRLSYP
ncbi:MAG: hypothetical protein NT154_05025 [Verrucomicrobia bacterium]|nr:hypothetical protein [Verrucomicrobiota bacterium]